MSVSLYGGMVTVTVEIAFSSSTGSYGAWDSAVWNTDQWGPDVTWTDVSAYVRHIETRRQYSRAINTWDAGTAGIVLDNRDGRFSPSNASGPYVSAGVTGVRPWRPVRIRATYGGVTYHLYRGYALAFTEAWTKAPSGKGDATVTVPCVDELASLARVDGAAAGAVGAGETTGARITRLLNAAGHTGPRAIDNGNITVQATTLSANVVDEIHLTVDTEGGSLFVDADGTVVFERNYALIENTRSNTVQATFADDGVNFGYRDVAAAYNGDLLVNIANLTRVGGTVQTVTDATSRALYGDKRFTRTDLISSTDAQALALAQYLIAQYAAPEQRITHVTFKPTRAPATLFPQALGRRIRDLVNAQRTPPGGYTISQNCHISGIGHTITPSGWETGFDLWSATPYQLAGRWDVGTWDTSKWFI